MKIGFDIRPLQTHSNYRGIGRYLYEILNNLPDESKNDEFVFYYDPSLKIPEIIQNKFSKYRLLKVKSKSVSKIKYARALFPLNSKVKPKKNDVDVFFQAEASFGIPKSVPCVAVFMDLIPMLFILDHKEMGLNGIAKYKQILGQKRQNSIYTAVLKSYSNAKKIISISKASKNDYAKYVDPKVAENIVVTHLAVSKNNALKPKEYESNMYLKKIGLVKGKYLLYVGAVDLRKNIKCLPGILKKVRENNPDVKLVVVGKEFGIKKELEKVGWIDAVNKTGTAKNIISPGYISDLELNILYRNAGVFLFPSMYEGFGLPILEAMQQSCPVVCLNNSSLPEVAGDAALLMSTTEEMVDATNKILNNKTHRNYLINRGLERVKHFSWEKTAKETYEIIKNAL